MRTRAATRESQRRRGSAYVAVIGSAMMVSVIGLSGLMLVRAERQATAGTMDMVEAKFLAQSAMELGQHYLRDDPDWRTKFDNGTWEIDRVLGRGKLSVVGVDPVDGDLADSLADPLLLTGIGAVGEARYKLQATLAPAYAAVGAIGVSAHAGANLQFSTLSIVTSNQKITANGNSTAATATVTAAVEVSGNANGAVYLPLPVSGRPARSMPDSTAFDYYTTNGASINYASLPSGGGGRRIESVLLSPGSNPFGATDNEGIYVVNCGAGKLEVRDVRIVGTLVAINCSTSTVDAAIAWEPAVANYPSLLVQGNLALSCGGSALSESSENVNFNPAGAPYGGVSDSDKSDSYPSRINGLVYASGSITTSNAVTINGVLVAGQSINVSGTLSLTYSDTFHSNPPPGFGTPTTAMELSAGSWQRVVD